MKKIILLMFAAFLLSGCATYKFQKGLPPHDKGYVASRDGKVILEYTVGKDDSVPDLTIAKQRFKRRRVTVEDYCKKIGSVENRFKEMFVDYPVMIFKFITGVFRLPFIAVSEYKYEHDPEYRKKIQAIEAKKDVEERARIKEIRDKLNAYIKEDLAKEPPLAEKLPEKEVSAPAVLSEPKPEAIPVSVPAPEQVAQVQPQQEKAKEDIAQEPVVVQKEGKVSEEIKEELPVEPQKEEIKVDQLKEKSTEIDLQIQEQESLVKQPEVKEPVEESLKEAVPSKKISTQSPHIVISAKPNKGFSPLRVHFYAKAYSPKAKIVSYEWDFGDGDTSKLQNPYNTFISSSYGSKLYTVTVTVYDNKGGSATASTVIEVKNK
ncbi:MAG: PKD domain-containing protein [Candidatus Omnitrophica bacterium]|nr:PKD domain-containing protein [Candidatus Omnitrophota bacterium]